MSVFCTFVLGLCVFAFGSYTLTRTSVQFALHWRILVYTGCVIIGFVLIWHGLSVSFSREAR